LRFPPPDVIVLTVRWYLRFGLSYRDVEELLTERGVEVDHVTVSRWVQRFTPLLAGAIGITKATPVEVVTDRAPVYPLVGSSRTFAEVATNWPSRNQRTGG
jgi:hypothetical protein